VNDRVWDAIVLESDQTVWRDVKRFGFGSVNSVTSITTEPSNPAWTILITAALPIGAADEGSRF